MLHLHAAALEADEVTVVGGVPVTSVARTVADLGRLLPFESALVPADAALHLCRVTPAELRDSVKRAAHRLGNGDARRVVEFADGRSESPGETRSPVARSAQGRSAPRGPRRLCEDAQRHRPPAGSTPPC